MLTEWFYRQIYRVYFSSYRAWRTRDSKAGELVFRCSVGVAQRFFPGHYTNWLNKHPVYGLNRTEERSEKIVASLTTFPARIHKVSLTIETIMHQSVKADAIELWLSREQFPGEEKDLPQDLLDLQSRGLSICFADDDLRSHKKYYYAMQKHPNAIVITFDDDCFYPVDTIEQLLRGHNRVPEDVVGFANTRFDKKDFMQPIRWKMQEIACYSLISIGVVGASGTLYPPAVLHNEAYNTQKIKELSFYADDQWLTVMTYMNGRKITTLGRLPFPVSIPDTQAVALTKTNNSVDAQINNNTQWRKTIEFYRDDLRDWLSQMGVENG